MTPYETLVVGRAVARVLADSERTDEIHHVEEITGRDRFRHLLRDMARSSEAQRLLRERPELNSEQVDFAALRALPAHTLGGRYVRHLDDHGLTADSQATATRYIADPDIAYLMRRFRQTHDVWHALLDLGVAGHEEVIIHAFSWGQLRLPVSALVVLLGTLKHIVLERRWGALRHALLEAYRSGRNAAPLMSVYWENMWDRPIEEVRRNYGIRPCTRAHVHG